MRFHRSGRPRAPGPVVYAIVTVSPIIRDSGGPGKATYASWKALDAVCKKSRGDGSTTAKCPSALFFRTPKVRDPGTLEVEALGPNRLLVTFPPVGGSYDRWRLTWREGAWRLTAIDSIAQQRDEPELAQSARGWPACQRPR